jgi:hypothetical protein
MEPSAASQCAIDPISITNTRGETLIGRIYHPVARRGERTPVSCCVLVHGLMSDQNFPLLGMSPFFVIRYA